MASIIGNRFIDLFLGVKGAVASAVRLAPWPDEGTRALFWTCATLIDSLVDATRQTARIVVAADGFPVDALRYVSLARGLLTPRTTGFNWRGWVTAHWAQHAVSGTKGGIIAGCNASHSTPIVEVRSVLVDTGSPGSGWVCVLPEGTPQSEWDDGSAWGVDFYWDAAVPDLYTLGKAAQYWGPAKRFLGFVIEGP